VTKAPDGDTCSNAIDPWQDSSYMKQRVFWCMPIDASAALQNQAVELLWQHWLQQRLMTTGMLL
jgi:hypothetical protein